MCRRAEISSIVRICCLFQQEYIFNRTVNFDWFSTKTGTKPGSTQHQLTIDLRMYVSACKCICILGSQHTTEICIAFKLVVCVFKTALCISILILAVFIYILKCSLVFGFCIRCCLLYWIWIDIYIHNVCTLLLPLLPLGSSLVYFIIAHSQFYVLNLHRCECVSRIEIAPHAKYICVYGTKICQFLQPPKVYCHKLLPAVAW